MPDTTTVTKTTGDIPVYWTVRQSGEPVPAWAERMARAYAGAHPGALGRLAAISRTDYLAHASRTRKGLPDMDSQPTS